MARVTADGRSALNRYGRIIEAIFLSNFQEGAAEVVFGRQQIIDAARELGIRLPSNIGDVIYSFRYRAALPESIRAKAPEGKEWIIRPAGRSRYRFVATATGTILPSSLVAETKVPDATPGIITLYALTDEQALLAKLRYNRLVDIFTGVTCYSLQNHLRTTVRLLGQVETDEIYVGVDRRGAHYVFPVQAKGGRDRLSIVQIEQDVALCAEKFPGLVCRPIAAQFLQGDLIALFDFEEGPNGLALLSEKQYRLVPPDSLSAADLELYRHRPS
ncbi:MAG: endonuclease [Chloroflexota bacterium]